jgi:hypothetical protein
MSAGNDEPARALVWGANSHGQAICIAIGTLFMNSSSLCSCVSPTYAIVTYQRAANCTVRPSPPHTLPQSAAPPTFHCRTAVVRARDHGRMRRAPYRATRLPSRRVVMRQLRRPAARSRSACVCASVARVIAVASCQCRARRVRVRAFCLGAGERRVLGLGQQRSRAARRELCRLTVLQAATVSPLLLRLFQPLI